MGRSAAVTQGGLPPIRYATMSPVAFARLGPRCGRERTRHTPEDSGADNAMQRRCAAPLRHQRFRFVYPPARRVDRPRVR